MSARNPRPRPHLLWVPGPIAGPFDDNAARASSMLCCTTIELARICSLGFGAQTHSFLSHCRSSFQLSARPTNDVGERVTPSNLLDHRRSHDFKGPSCLCASLNSSETAYTEAAIFMATRGPSAGKYVAACATGQCRYWGEYRFIRIRKARLTHTYGAVSLEHFYHQLGLLVKRYRRRGKPLSRSRGATEFATGLNRNGHGRTCCPFGTPLTVFCCTQTA
jgi:hypothetical protein